MRNRNKHILKIFAFTMFLALAIVSSGYAQRLEPSGSDGQSSSREPYSLPDISFDSQPTCKSECGNSTCELQFGNDGRLPNECSDKVNNAIDTNCIISKNKSNGACLDTIPASSVRRVSETNCYRPNGAGGNTKPRNHKGVDYASAAGTIVTAAADGVIKSAIRVTGGGRALMIEHEKKCQCTAGQQNGGCDNKFVTVYLHLKGYIKTSGSVTRGEPVAYVGGSNYQNGILCDAGEKKAGCNPYSPHLHFEIHSVRNGKNYTYSSLNSSSVVNPLCDDIQTFCGGCSYELAECTGQEKTEMENPQVGGEEEPEQPPVTQPEPQPEPQVTTPPPPPPVYPKVKNCELENFLPRSEDCWFCPLFRILFNTASKAALKSYTILADGVAALVIVGFALWLAVYVLRHVAAIEVKQPSKMLQEILLQAFKVLVVVLILKVSFYQVVQLTLEPVFNTGLAFTNIITGQGSTDSRNPSQNLSCPSGASYMQSINGYDTDFNEHSEGGLPRSMGASIICGIKNIQDGIGLMLAYGRQARCIGWRSDKAFIKYIIPSFPYVFTGDFLIVGALILLLAFPWCLIDCVLQMAIAAALAPAAIGAWAFKATSRYLKMIWDYFMNAMFSFVFLSIIIYIIMTVVSQFMNALTAYAATSGDWDFLIDPINGLAYWGVTGLKLVVVCLLGWVFLDEGKNFADKYAKAADVGGIGRSVGGMFAQTGKKATQISFKAGETIGKAGLQVADRYVGSHIRQAQTNYRVNRVMRNGTALRDGNGNIVGYESTERNLLGKKVTRTVSIDPSGKKVWSKTRKSYFGSDSVRITVGASIKKRERLNAAGEVIMEDFKFKGAAGLHLSNEDGTVDMNRVNDLIANSGLNKEDVMKAVGIEVMKQRGGQFNTYFKSRNVTFDQNGNMHMTQVNEDGTEVKFNMGIGGPDNNQMLTEFIHTEKDGSYSVLFSNGIQNKNISYRAGSPQATVSYNFADEYYRRYKHLKPLNAAGRFGARMNIPATMYGFDATDHSLHTAQVATGKAQTTAAAYTSRI